MVRPNPHHAAGCRRNAVASFDELRAARNDEPAAGIFVSIKREARLREREQC